MRRSGARSIWVLAGFVGSVCALGPVPTQVISVAKTLARGSFLRISADMSGGLPLDHWKTRSVRFPSEGPVESLCNIWRQQGGLPAFWAGTPAVLFQGFFCGALLMAAKVSPSLARALFLALALLLSLSCSLSLSLALSVSLALALSHTHSLARALSRCHTPRLRACVICDAHVGVFYTGLSHASTHARARARAHTHTHTLCRRAQRAHSCAHECPWARQSSAALQAS